MGEGDLVYDDSINRRGLIVDAVMDGEQVHEFVILYEDGNFDNAFPFEIEVIDDNT
jgi:hypothetical protein